LNIVISKIKSKNRNRYIYILISLIILVSSLGIIFKERFLNYITAPFIKAQNNVIDNGTDDSSDDDKLIEDSNENDDETIKDTPTLEEYLSKLFCNGCGRHCPLSSPGCNRGYSYREEAANRYYEKYNTSYNDNKNYIVSIENYTVSINNKNI
jgi:ABC-type antimicrobial peptide transport system permease subunit